MNYTFKPATSSYNNHAKCDKKSHNITDIKRSHISSLGQNFDVEFGLIMDRTVAGSFILWKAFCNLFIL